jgi:hypothetical protein
MFTMAGNNGPSAGDNRGKYRSHETPANSSFWYGAGDAGDVPGSSFGKSAV